MEVYLEDTAQASLALLGQAQKKFSSTRLLRSDSWF
jgi:hypothetical protein